MCNVLYRCPECSSTNLTFDVSGAVYDPISEKFTACVGQEGEAECLDCGYTRITAIKEYLPSKERSRRYD